MSLKIYCKETLLIIGIIIGCMILSSFVTTMLGEIFGLDGYSPKRSVQAANLSISLIVCALLAKYGKFYTSKILGFLILSVPCMLVTAAKISPGLTVFLMAADTPDESFRYISYIWGFISASQILLPFLIFPLLKLFKNRASVQ